ncbi:monovalent cation/H+ antiporter subunit D [Pseudoxanthomonas mexicana]|uniref:monovalent cation/H+ antiporter subunit D n=1 Tax=Pseudoxanthomonas mexicana TaxID=128785 RepID=UPI00398B4938
MTQHLAILPILLPLMAGALVLMSERRGILAQRAIALTAMAALLAVAIALLWRAGRGETLVYLLGDWPARLGIALMADRLSALMVLAAALLALPCLLYACAGWDQRSPHFHALFQFQLVGINGAFLTADAFNLFVFFEVMLIASYGLMLSGGRNVRMRVGLHYVVFNVTASTLFLIALGVLYGMLGTLNMAEMALRVGQAPAGNLPLIQAAGALMLLVFCAKAALLPLYLWLPEAYTRAPAAIAALFAIMTKVGLYAVLRVGTLIFGPLAGALAGFAWQWLLPLGLATLALASLGVMAATRLRALVAYLVLVSAATLFVAFALARPETIAAGLYYLLHSTFVAAALFLIADLVRRSRGEAGDRFGVAAPMHRRAKLGLVFLVAAVSVAGLPPLSGFLGKLMVLDATPAGQAGWVWSIVLASSFIVIAALARAGSALFWRVEDDGVPMRRPVRAVETGAVLLLLGYGVAMTVAAAPVLDYARATADQLLDPQAVVDRVRQTPPQLREPSP